MDEFRAAERLLSVSYDGLPGGMDGIHFEGPLVGRRTELRTQQSCKLLHSERLLQHGASGVARLAVPASYSPS